MAATPSSAIATPSIILTDSLDTPPILFYDTTLQFYKKGTLLVIQQRTGGVTTYFSLNLAATTDQMWIYSATAP